MTTARLALCQTVFPFENGGIQARLQTRAIIMSMLQIVLFITFAGSRPVLQVQQRMQRGAVYAQTVNLPIVMAPAHHVLNREIVPPKMQAQGAPAVAPTPLM